MKLRLRLPSDPTPMTIELDDAMQLQDINEAIASKVGQPSSAFEFLAGHPPRRPKPEEMALTIKEVLRNGDMLTIQAATANPGDNVKRGHTDGKYVPPIETRNSTFVKHDVPGDNSCLFHSVGWLFEKQAPELRKLVSEMVLANPVKYTEAFLGATPPAYARHILDPNSWGGAIEIDLLSFVFQTEICVLDMTSKRHMMFGQGNGYSTRGFVFYTGNHYDGAGIGNTMNGGSLQKIFSTRDERPLALADDYLAGRVKAA
jgi:ubiquitin thioesterase OTU1